MIMNTNAGIQKGTPHVLNINSYSTKTTRYIRNAEPSNRDTIKNNAPVRSDTLPILSPK